VATTDQKTMSWIWRLPPAEHSIEDLVTLARLLNGDMTDANKTPAESYAEFLQRFQKLRERYPEQFVVSNPELLAWYEQQLSLAQQEGDVEAVSFYGDHIRSLGGTF